MIRKIAAVFALGAMFGISGPALAGDCAASASACPVGKATKASAKVDKMHSMDIVDMAIHTGTFNTLVAAVKAANLVGTLKGEGPFTVFAPTDEAFAKLPEGTVDDLLKPENREKLVAILTYHVVPGKVTSSQVVNLASASTVQGGDVAITSKYGKVMVDNATVVQADIETSNGVIHVIDEVILPKS